MPLCSALLAETFPRVRQRCSRFARYVDRWSDPWCDKEIRWLLGYLKHTAEYMLRMISRGDLWEDMWAAVRSDANFMLVDTGSAALAAAVYDRLKAAGILVRYWGRRATPPPKEAGSHLAYRCHTL